MAIYTLDAETYRNYFLVLFKEVGSKNTHCFELYDGVSLDQPALSDLMRNNTTVSFNGNHYDLYMIEAALQGRDNSDLKDLSDEIITSGKPGWMIAKAWDVEQPRSPYGSLLWNHVDLIDVAPGKASLKIYGGRLNAPKLQDLPIEPDAIISPEQREELRTYCLNDLETTELLYNEKASCKKATRNRLRKNSNAVSVVIKAAVLNAQSTAQKISPTEWMIWSAT